MARPSVLLVAEEAAGLQALKLLAESGHRITGVLSSSGEERGASVARAAADLGLPVLDPALVTDPGFAAEVGSADLLLNVHSLHVAHAEVVAVPRIGGFNLHPGPLPDYAGLNAPSWAIYDGRDEHAVTLHWMEPEVDTGAIAYSAEFPIEPGDTGLGLSAKCVKHGLPLIERLLADAEAGRIPRHEQDPSRRRWHGSEPPHGGALPWTLPGARVVDLVRAADYTPFESPWGHPAATLDGRRFEFVRVAASGEPADVPPGSVREGGQVAARDEWIRVVRLREDGKRVDAANALPPGSRFNAQPES